jgi:translocator protein
MLDVRRGLTFLFFVALPQAVGGASALLSRGSTGWYEELRRPDWAPPGWVFGPVWTLLYLTMGVAAWLVYDAPRSGLRRMALALFAVQLALNFLWSPVFFALRQIGWALAEMALLWVAVGATMAVFFKVRRAAGLLLVPYWAWVTFAAVLNFALWRLNRGAG